MDVFDMWVTRLRVMKELLHSAFIDLYYRQLEPMVERAADHLIQAKNCLPDQRHECIVLAAEELAKVIKSLEGSGSHLAETFRALLVNIVGTP